MRLRRTGRTGARPSPEDRFWHHVDFGGPLPAIRPELGACWLWTGPLAGGCPVLWVNGRNIRAYTFAWGLAWGEPPPLGLKFTHFACGLVVCVNPQHVRPKVATENALGMSNLAAWNAVHDACILGHAFTPANSILVPGGRVCRECRKDVERVRRTA
jgi:hypothetical protein